MILRKPMRTDRRLWLMFGTLAFVLLGFVGLHNEVVEGKIGPTSFWGSLVQPSAGWGWRTPLIIGFHAILTAIPATAFGWVAQAVLVTIRTARSADQTIHQTK